MNLYINEHLVKNEEKRVFIVHGISEHSGRYEHFVKFLNSNNISVITYDLRGHGKSPGKYGFIQDYKDHIKDLTLVIEKYNNPQVKQFLIGHSMGGLIGHLYMIEKPVVDGYISIAAPTNYIKDVKLLKIIGYRWLGWIKIANKFADDKLSHNKQVEEDYNNDPLVGKYIYLRLIGEMFVRGVKHLNKNIDKNNKPILLLHGTKDKIVPYQFSQRIYNLINHNDKELILYDNMYHEILNEVDNLKVYKDILEWLNER